MWKTYITEHEFWSILVILANIYFSLVFIYYAKYADPFSLQAGKKTQREKL